MHGVRDRVPVGGAIRPVDRGDTPSDRTARLPVAQRPALRGLIFALFPHPQRLRWVSLGLWAYQQLGLQRAARASGLLTLLPARLRAMEAMAPPISLASAWARFPALVRAAGRPRRRVGLVLGCVQRVFFDEVNRATARVLAAEGCDVVVPAAQGCCGALAMHAGIEHDAETRARRTIDAFEEAEVDTIVTNAAGCGSTLKQYGHLLRDDPRTPIGPPRSQPTCMDISEVLAELEPRAPRHAATAGGVSRRVSPAACSGDQRAAA